MGKKLEQNGLWESSRMMLPQHREESLRQTKESGRRPRPTLDTQEQDRILQEIGQALRWKSRITLTVYDPYKDRTVAGVPINYDQQRRTLKIEVDGEPEWIAFADITGAAGSDCLTL